jgi:hypothetical protein
MQHMHSSTRDLREALFLGYLLDDLDERRMALALVAGHQRWVSAIQLVEKSVDIFTVVHA